MKIGVLALQGNFERHYKTLEELHQTPVLVKKASHLQDVAGLILPGGESTTHIKLLENSDLLPAIINLYQQKKPIFGTCAGLILISKTIINDSQFSFGFLDISVLRNAYGSQRESFAEDILIPTIGMPKFPCVFIRAPQIVNNIQQPDVEILAKFQDYPILVRQGSLLGATFHPEMTQDIRIHQLFINMCR